MEYEFIELKDINRKENKGINFFNLLFFERVESEDEYVPKHTDVEYVNYLFRHRKSFKLVRAKKTDVMPDLKDIKPMTHKKLINKLIKIQKAVGADSLGLFVVKKEES